MCVAGGARPDRVDLIDEQECGGRAAGGGKAFAHRGQHFAQMPGGLPFGKAGLHAGDPGGIAHGERQPSLTLAALPVPGGP